jgi:predicted O-methyltransferase YrrM
MNDIIKQIYNDRSVQDADGNSINPFPSAIPEESGVILFHLVKNLELDNTLEVGMGYGLSTLHICQAHRERGCGRHVAIDPNQETNYKSIGRMNIQKAGLQDIVKLYVAPSHRVLPQLVELKEHFDLAFIDGCHRFDFALVDFFYIDMLLKDEGYLVLDDMWLPQIRKLVSYILRNRSYKAVSYPCSLAFWRRILRFGRRFVQNPWELDYHLKMSPHNIFILQKTGHDAKVFGSHHFF